MLSGSNAGMGTRPGCSVDIMADEKSPKGTLVEKAKNRKRESDRAVTRGRTVFSVGESFEIEGCKTNSEMAVLLLHQILAGLLSYL